MQNSKSHRNGQGEPHRRGKLTNKSSSFHSNSSPAAAMSGTSIRRPVTLPELLINRNRATAAAAAAEVVPRQPPKLLLKVTIMGSLGPVQVVMTTESTVGDLVAAAVNQYIKEGRRPILPSNDPSQFDLHYSQFTLESNLPSPKNLILLNGKLLMELILLLLFFECRFGQKGEAERYWV